MPRRAKKSAGSWMTPVSSCMIGQPGPHPPPPAALPTTQVNPFLPVSGSVGGTLSPANVVLPSPPTNAPSVPSNLPPGFLPHPNPNNNTSQPSLTGGVLDPLSQGILFVNTNPYIIGCFMLILNLGGRFLSLELTKKQEEFLAAPWIRPALFFTVVFIATRNLAAAFWVTLLFFSIIWVVANEHSPYCLIPSWCGHDIQKETNIYEANAKKCSSLKPVETVPNKPVVSKEPKLPEE